MNNYIRILVFITALVIESHSYDGFEQANFNIVYNTHDHHSEEVDCMRYSGSTYIHEHLLYHGYVIDLAADINVTNVTGKNVCGCKLGMDVALSLVYEQYEDSGNTFYYVDCDGSEVRTLERKGIHDSYIGWVRNDVSQYMRELYIRREYKTDNELIQFVHTQAPLQSIVNLKRELDGIKEELSKVK